jgi:hypothetical protein
MKHGRLSVFIFLIALLVISSGCTSAEGTLADYLGWQSLGGNWRGTLSLSDDREMPFAMTFTEFDGNSFHVLTEAGEGADYINNQADAVYSQADRSFSYDLIPFFAGPCHVSGALVDKYNISGSLQVNNGDSTLVGTYELTFTP